MARYLKDGYFKKGPGRVIPILTQTDCIDKHTGWDSAEGAQKEKLEEAEEEIDHIMQELEQLRGGKKQKLADGKASYATQKRQLK